MKLYGMERCSMLGQHQLFGASSAHIEDKYTTIFTGRGEYVIGRAVYGETINWFLVWKSVDMFSANR